MKRETRRLRLRSCLGESHRSRKYERLPCDADRVARSEFSNIIHRPALPPKTMMASPHGFLGGEHRKIILKIENPGLRFISFPLLVPKVFKAACFHHPYGMTLDLTKYAHVR
jgi:hypothetical protein